MQKCYPYTVSPTGLLIRVFIATSLSNLFYVGHTLHVLASSSNSLWWKNSFPLGNNDCLFNRRKQSQPSFTIKGSIQALHQIVFPNFGPALGRHYPQILRCPPPLTCWCNTQTCWDIHCFCEDIRIWFWNNYISLLLISSF